MNVFVLYRYWDTPDNDGNEVCGVYKYVDNAISIMKKDAEHVKSYYQDDYWDEDMTWEDELEIHLGRDSHNPYEPATVYCWTITKAEVQ